MARQWGITSLIHLITIQVQSHQKQNHAICVVSKAILLKTVQMNVSFFKSNSEQLTFPIISARPDGNNPNNPGGVSQGFSLKYAPNPNQNQNPLDRVVDRKPPEIDKSDMRNTHEKRGTK